MTSEGLGDVKPWGEEHGPKYPLLIEPDGTSAKAFGVRGIPHAYLIDPQGNVLWHGHPAQLTEPLIDKALVGAVPLFEPLAGPLLQLQPLLDEQATGKAVALLETLQADASLDGKQKAQAAFRLRNLDRDAEQAFAVAAQRLADERPFDAVLQLQEIALLWDGCRHADAARQKLAGLGKDAALKREADACVFLAKARQLERLQRYDEAWSTYRRVLVFSRTQAEEFGKLAMKRIDGGGLRGFKTDCEACKGEGKACKKHKRR